MNKNSKLITPACAEASAGRQNSKPKPKSQNFFGKFFCEIRTKKIEYFLLFIILSFSAFFRLYKLDKLLGFWYDQGRDALVIWDLIHNGKLFLIGPVTGIEGIFLGPFYYLLLAPFYWLGKGSPVFVTAFLGWLTVAAIYLIYYLTNKIYGRKPALLAVFLYGFSYSLVGFSRWLANPNPLPFFTMVLLVLLYQFMEGRSQRLIGAGFVLGLCLQLEAASAIFFIPSIIVFLIWQRKKIKNFKILFLAFLAFFVTLIPQIYFNFRHQGVLAQAFRKFILEEKSFNISVDWLQLLKERLRLYYDVFFDKFFSTADDYKLYALALFSANLLFFRKKVFNQGGKLLAIWVIVPLLGYFFYRGNNGYIWNYYFTGLIPAFIILFAASFWQLAEKRWLGKVILCLFLFLFLSNNIRFLRNYFERGVGISLGAELRAIDWIYNDAGSEEFNVDVYVPPKISFSYLYLFRWYGLGKYGREPAAELVKNLYTLEEPDKEHPWFLTDWLKRQDGIGNIIKTYSWGSISVQRRERVKYE